MPIPRFPLSRLLHSSTVPGELERRRRVVVDRDHCRLTRQSLRISGCNLSYAPPGANYSARADQAPRHKVWPSPEKRFRAEKTSSATGAVEKYIRNDFLQRTRWF